MGSLAMGNVKLRVFNPHYKHKERYAKSVVVPEYYDIRGAPARNPAWVGEDCVCLRRGDGFLSVIPEAHTVYR